MNERSTEVHNLFVADTIYAIVHTLRI